MRSLGLDVGARRIGVAISDPLGVAAYPHEVLYDLDPAGLRRYVEEKAREGVGLVVVGLPLTLRGEEGRQAQKAREYADALAGLEGIDVVLWDERLSTVEAGRRLKEAGKKPGGKGMDAEAAAVILQSYLEYTGRQAGQGQGNGD